MEKVEIYNQRWNSFSEVRQYEWQNEVSALCKIYDVKCYESRILYNVDVQGVE